MTYEVLGSKYNHKSCHTLYFIPNTLYLCYENHLLECEWNKSCRKKGPIWAVYREISARYTLPTGDQGRTRPSRNRFKRIRRIMEFGQKEGIFWDGDLHKGKADCCRQRFAARYL